MERYGWWEEPQRRRAWNEEDERDRRRSYETWRDEPYGREERGEYERSGWEGERHARRELDRPWVERGPEARRRGETRGLVEWEDRGPLEWLGSKVRDATRKAGRGPKGYQRSDERIREELCERIARSGMDADDVEVTVENREVTLSGSVASRREKWWLEDLADDVLGVEDVHDRLHVRRTDEPGRPPGSTPPVEPRH